MASVVSSENVCVSPTVARLLRELSCILGQESSPLDGVMGQVERLHGKLTGIQTVLEDAEEKQLSDQLVKNWLRKLRESACDAEDVLDYLITEARLQERDQVRYSVDRSDVFQPSNKLRESAGSIMRDLLDRLEGIDKDKEQLLLSRLRESGSDRGKHRETDTSHLEDAQFVVGREDDKSSIIKLLLSNDFDNGTDGIPVIPIIGMGGLGKTTLSHLVFNDGEVRQRFESRMWVCVTDDFDLKRIWREMIKFHSKMPIESSLSEATLESRILEFLKGKPFLLVLDDVWPETCKDWGKLKTVLSKGGRGTKVLITSRNEKVSEIMGTREPYRLGCLPEDECLSLFNKIAFKGNSCFSGLRKELEQIGKGIVQKCKGLPLAVKAMAGLLRDMEDVSKWKAIFRSDIWEVEEKNEDDEVGSLRVLPALQLSYNHLPSILKQCFVYCSIFPKNYVLRKPSLIKLWTAEAFLQSIDVDKTPQEVGSEYCNELLMRSFFQLTDIDGEYKMHDLIHDMATSVSKPYCFQVKGIGSSRSSESSRHVSLMCRDVVRPLLEIGANSKKLRTLLLPTDYLKNFGQALDTLFVSLPYMRALDLSSSELKQLPDSIAELKLLRYLDLSETEIRELPNSICRLYNLETLKLLGCRWLFELPEDLADLVNLCHLELDDMFWFKVTSLPPRMGNLTKLQNLHKFIVGQDPGHGIGELNRLVSLDGSLHLSKLENARDAADANLKEKVKLHEVVFEWSSSVDDLEQVEADHMRVFEDLQPHTNLPILKVSYYKGSAFPSWLRDGLSWRLVHVSLAHCINCKILSIGELPLLRKLKLKGMQKLEEWPGSCPYLLTLKISYCPKLKKLPLLFPIMRSMKIKCCDSLEVLPVTPRLQFLSLDSNSSLEDWQEKHYVLIHPKEEAKFDVERVWSFSNVLEMKIIGCPKLEGLPKMFAPQQLEIHNCELIRTLPPKYHAARLQHLALVGCNDGTLVRAIPRSESLYSLVISGISNLSAFTEWPQLLGLKFLYIHDCQHLESLTSETGESLQVLTSVKLLSVQNCPKLRTLAANGLPLELECLSIGSCSNLESLGPEGTLTCLARLNDVYIVDCPMLHSLPEDGFPTSVQHLSIENCPLLRTRCDQESRGPDWPKIKDIPDLEMFDFKVPSASCPSTMEVCLLPDDIPHKSPICSEETAPSNQLPDLSESVFEDHFMGPRQEQPAICAVSHLERENDGEACASHSHEIKSEDGLGFGKNTAYDPDMKTGPVAMYPDNDAPLVDDEFKDIESFYDSISADIDNDRSQSTTFNPIPKEEIQDALCSLRRFYSLDPVDANHPDLHSSSFHKALQVLHTLDQSFGINSHQVEGLRHLIKDWSHIASAASAAKEDQQRLSEQLSASNRVRTSLLDIASRDKTLKQQAGLLDSQHEEDQLKMRELEDRLQRVKAQSSQIKSQRSANFLQAKKLNPQLSQLRKEAAQHRRTLEDAETSLTDAEQQWGAFRDTVAEVTSLYR